MENFIKENRICYGFMGASISHALSSAHTIAGGGPGFGVDNLLLEDGCNFLLETGDVLLLE